MHDLSSRIEGLSPVKRRLLAICLEEEALDASWLDELHVAPRTPVETLLVKIYEEVLKVEGIGVHDNFFDLGGDSILSIRIVAKAALGGLQFSTKQVFEHPTISELAQVVRRAEPSQELVESVSEAPVPPLDGPLSVTDFPEADLTEEDLQLILSTVSKAEPSPAGLEGTELPEESFFRAPGELPRLAALRSARF